MAAVLAVGPAPSPALAQEARPEGESRVITFDPPPFFWPPPPVESDDPYGRPRIWASEPVLHYVSLQAEAGDLSWEERGEKLVNSFSAGPTRLENVRRFSRGDDLLKSARFTFEVVTRPPRLIEAGQEFEIEILGTVTNELPGTRFAETTTLQVRAPAIGIGPTLLKLSEHNPGETLKVAHTLPWKPPVNFTIHASIGHATIGWRYHLLRDWVDLLPAHLRPRAPGSPSGEWASAVVGRVENIRGQVDHYIFAFDRWQRGLRGGVPLYSKDVIRTGPNSSCRIVFTAGATTTSVAVGADTIIETPCVDLRGEMSWPAWLYYGMLRIRYRVPDSDGRDFGGPFVVRTPTVLIGSRGTEYAVQADRNGATTVYVREGAVWALNLRAETVTELDPGQRIAVREDGTQEAERLMQGEWDALVSAHGLGEPFEEPTEPADFPLLDARVTGLRFYEAGFDAPPLDQRRYATRFSSPQTRYIWYELGLEYPPPGRRVGFDIESVWYRPDGSVLTRQTYEAAVEADWDNSYHGQGWGEERAGSWRPGTYRVELFVAAQKVAAGSFEVTE